MPLKNETRAKIAFGELTLKEAFRAVENRCNLIVVDDDFYKYRVFREDDGFLCLYNADENELGLFREEVLEYQFDLDQKVKVLGDGAIELLDDEAVLAFKETKTIDLLGELFHKGS